MRKLTAIMVFGFTLLGWFPLKAQSNTNLLPGKFVPGKYGELPLGAIRPQGWLRYQLGIMRDGTTGHLDELYGKIRDDNGWLGGKGDAWEETPYWLDGALPLAYLLDDQPMKEKVLKYVNWVLENQRPSGYFGGITRFERESGTKITLDNLANGGDDWWPKMVMLKVMQQYYLATADNRVIEFMTKYFRFQMDALKICPVGKWTEWAQSRGADNVLMVQWLYSIIGESWLLQLADLIESQSYAWSDWLGNRDWVIHAATYQNSENWMHRHGVNVGMALKSPAVNYQRTGNPQYLDKLKTGFNDLMTLHGLPMGIFSADEDLHGNDPTQGAELCAIVEAMYSLEEIASITGDPQYMDALERMAFNALPTQTTDDYNAKQYFQIANQVQVKKGVFNFSLPFDREMNNVFGMRSGYTCCLANMHQGWSKFASHLWYSTPGKGLAALWYSPCVVKTIVGAKNTEVEISEKTNYPFGDVIDFELSTSKDVTFALQLRIPAWCSKAEILINGKLLKTETGGQIFTIDRVWKNGDKLTLKMPMEVKVSTWGRNSRAVERGPLVYALKLGERWEKGIDEKEGEYWSVYPTSDWNYGILEKAITDIKNVATVSMARPISDKFIWNLEYAPIQIKLPARKIPSWTLANDVAPQPVNDRQGIFKGTVSEQEETITLIPYGCTKVRVVAFPVVR